MMMMMMTTTTTMMKRMHLPCPFLVTAASLVDDVWLDWETLTLSVVATRQPSLRHQQPQQMRPRQSQQQILAYDDDGRLGDAKDSDAARDELN